MNLLIGIAAIAVAGLIWALLGRFAVGRAVQALVATLAYGAWLSIIPLSIYFVAKGIVEAAGEGSYGTAIFIGVISVTFTPMFILALIPWNFFCHYVWRKVGIRLPLSRRLAGDAPYEQWERES